ncbi:MAG: 16S rRNA (cytosine(1402)-N(4))-methyltransferase RsmH [Rhodospirillaceae bacterium]|jgi:16S rRNA (cytosine1402-N4)-methyltransferase|nr:16S rRNA (cytosine(1402)-N(4))-methyltransferase RsmH [Rhodospirillaceae bacterium]MBT5751464.1 16S rRNA (cytosine(1402)-N(4))-methyltransferase RsmH [Rhodospirillaceae bacterium]
MTSSTPLTTQHNEAPAHLPVMLTQVIDALAPKDGGIYIDGTFGAGGYSRALLEAAECTVWGIDRDPNAIAGGSALAQRHKGRLNLVMGRFGDMDRILSEKGVKAVDGITFDFGVSSMQIDQAERGFSFRFDGPLDMRMEGENADSPSAADVVNHTDEEDLANIIYMYGEERQSRRIAKAIVTARTGDPILRTGRLAEIVRGAMWKKPSKKGKSATDPATRTFQALRIHVNDELGEIDRGLVAAEKALSPGGQLAIVSFHSLEDRRVKNFLNSHSGAAARPSRHLPDDPESSPASSFRLVSKRALRPSEAETKANPRARSARLRVAERTTAPAWGNDADRVLRSKEKAR